MTPDTNKNQNIGRRRLLGAGTALAAGSAVLAMGGEAAAASTMGGVNIPRPDSPLPLIPVPSQVNATEGTVSLPDVRLWYWDTGGSGAPIVFLHPATGSAESWPYQQPYFAKRGYRVIAYSRRGHYRSENGPDADPGSGTEDLRRLLDHLGVNRFHGVGVAAGGGYLLDFALSYPERLRSMVISGSLTGLAEPAYRETLTRLRPAGFSAMPPDFIELGPTYRAANPDGVRVWLDLHHRSVNKTIFQRYENAPTWPDLERLRVPTLLAWGDSDLYSPPSVQRMLADHLPRVDTLVVNECGHQPHWERSDIYNPALLNFFRKNSR
ncbi:alpha/beta hydrolase [Spongiactinospora sp. TRM90649]|uniref:alpha/beta fold hydrolase n=1 Tax=Spongiactinospora sp. TRM90649 TaxID=3031114 RepID=UPI0023F6B134|nr:alpha/beta hydrolase [Spongiactinospora sp. TRM90649]MDF5758673.1 alpha/beta hydrolase [Spongiactinospora sp. TRM90649]